MRATFTRRGNPGEMVSSVTFGFVRLEDGRTAFLHKKAFSGSWKTLKIGDSLDVEIATSDRGLRVTAAQTLASASFKAAEAALNGSDLLPKIKATLEAACGKALYPRVVGDQVWVGVRALSYDAQDALLPVAAQFGQATLVQDTIKIVPA